MKHFIAAVLVIFIVWGLTAYNLYLLETKLSSIDSLVVEAIDSAKHGDFTVALAVLKATEKELGADEAYYRLVLNHSDIELLSIGVLKLVCYAEEAKRTDFLLTAAELRRAIAQIKRGETLSFENIM